MQQIEALRFDVEEVGKHVKGSKKRFTWDVSLKGKHHSIGLDFSFISGKVKITVDRKILLENELPSNVSFQYPFTLDGYALNIIQQGQTFELRINNKVFSHLYTQQKTNTEFKKYEDEVKDIKVNIGSLNPNQKISLNIGAFGGMKKKKEKVGESAGWDAFSGGSFPNYFGDQAPPTEEKPAQLPAPKVSSLLDEDQKTEETSSSVPPPKKVEKDLLGDDESEPKKQQFFFDANVAVPQAPKPSSAVEEFNTMQQLFSSMNVSQPANKVVDFFAEESKPQITSPPAQVPSVVSTPNSSGFDLNFSGNSTNPQNFTTGFAYEHSNINSKAFSTSSPGNKSGDIDFFNMAAQESKAFGKKENPSNVEQPLSTDKSKLTDISVNDFMNQKKAAQLQFQLPENFGQPSGLTVQPSGSYIQSNSNDFNTMQLLFQTGSAGQSSQISMTPGNSGINSGFNVSSNQNPLNTLQNYFKANNSNITMNQQTFQPPQKSNLDFFKDNKPETFATMSGGASGGFDFNMANFGTMQANPAKGGQGEFNFDFGKKPAEKTKGQGTGDLI